jgi:hypothetical protein
VRNNSVEGTLVTFLARTVRERKQNSKSMAKIVSYISAVIALSLFASYSYAVSCPFHKDLLFVN